jgi:hypothetical protein
MISYAEKKGYNEMSTLIRAVLIHHFMSIALKEAPELSRNQMRKLIMKNIKKL